MNYAQSFLQLLYGGKDTRPEWQQKATQHMQQLNWGYHLGRFINCIEISLHAFKSICLSDGDLRPSVTPLTRFPPFIEGYSGTKLIDRFRTLEDESSPVERRRLSNGGTYQDLLNWIAINDVPAYSHIIMFTGLKKLPGGHVISGIVLPSEHDSKSLFLYDAQGFIPDSWLADDQFDDFYSIESFYVYQSEPTRKAVKKFVTKFENNELAVPHEDAEDKPTSYLDFLHNKIQSFIQLELFRIDAKQIVATYEDKYVSEKIDGYQKILDNLTHQDEQGITFTKLARCLLQTAKIAKQHAYSMNWLNPQSLNHYMSYFKGEVNHKLFEDTPSIQAYKDYIMRFLMMEIVRICMINEFYTAEIDKKVEKLIEHLEALETAELTDSQLLETIAEIKQTCCSHRHTLTWFAPESASAFEKYIAPIQSAIEHPHFTLDSSIC